ncbi:MAG: hypothetical protein ACJAYJ_003416 [Saprospiraceae bacterium]|jgi:hypothetical protein
MQFFCQKKIETIQKYKYILLRYCATPNGAAGFEEQNLNILLDFMNE